MDPKRPSECPFPNPPAYYLNYTSKRVADGLTPAPPMIPPRYRVFGEDINARKVKILPSLRKFGQPQLYERPRSMPEIKYELKKLNRSIMSAFMDLTQILIENPESSERSDKLDQIRLLFINFHHLINELRPIQARCIIDATQKNHLLKLVTILDGIRASRDAANATLIAGQEFVKDHWIMPMPRRVEPYDEETLVQHFKHIEFPKDFEDVAENPLLAAVHDELDSKNANENEQKYMLEHWEEPSDDVDSEDESESEESADSEEDESEDDSDSDDDEVDSDGSGSDDDGDSDDDEDVSSNEEEESEDAVMEVDTRNLGTFDTIYKDAYGNVSRASTSDEESDGEEDSGDDSSEEDSQDSYSEEGTDEEASGSDVSDGSVSGESDNDEDGDNDVEMQSLSDNDEEALKSAGQGNVQSGAETAEIADPTIASGGEIAQAPQAVTISNKATDDQGHGGDAVEDEEGSEDDAEAESNDEFADDEEDGESDSDDDALDESEYSDDAFEDEEDEDIEPDEFGEVPYEEEEPLNLPERHRQLFDENLAISDGNRDESDEEAAFNVIYEKKQRRPKRPTKKPKSLLNSVAFQEYMALHGVDEDADPEEIAQLREQFIAEGGESSDSTQSGSASSESDGDSDDEEPTRIDVTIPVVEGENGTPHRVVKKKTIVISSDSSDLSSDDSETEGVVIQSLLENTGYVPYPEDLEASAEDDDEEESGESESGEDDNFAEDSDDEAGSVSGESAESGDDSDLDGEDSGEDASGSDENIDEGGDSDGSEESDADGDEDEDIEMQSDDEQRSESSPEDPASAERTEMTEEDLLLDSPDAGDDTNSGEIGDAEADLLLGDDDGGYQGNPEARAADNQ